MVTRARLVVLGLAALCLSACSNVHPGSAAVVDGRSISMRTLDETAAAFCTLTVDAASQQGVTTISNSEVRRQAIVSMVSLRVARDLATSENLRIDPESYQLTAAQRQQVGEVFPDSDPGDLISAIEESQEVVAIAVALAERMTGEQATEQNRAQLAEVGQTAIQEAFRSKDVKFSPRFGLDPAGQVRADTGSISVSPVDLEAPVDEELPAALRCS